MARFVRVLAVMFIFVFPGVSFAALDHYFISTQKLAEIKGDVVVVDVRKGPLYLFGHIEGSLHVEREEFLETRNNVKSLVPSAAAIATLLGNLGVTPETTVVAYAEDDNPYAARFVWTLRYHGHNKSFVLDGGYDKWAAEGRATAILPSADPQPTVYEFSKDRNVYSQARADADYVYTRLQNPAVIVWDTRRISEFQGTEVRADRGGHIPGAIHLDWTTLQTEVNGVKVLKSQEQIVELLKNRGLTSDYEILAHCQTGIRSSYATLVLLGLGYEQVKNYDGSWFEWANNPTYPIIEANKLKSDANSVSMN